VHFESDSTYRQVRDALSVERQPAMAAVDATALRLAAIVETSDDAIISKDLDGRIESWNESAERIFGYTAAEAIGQSIRMIIPAERYSEEDEVLSRIRRGESVKHYETVRVRKDGSKIEISLTVSPIRTADGQIIGASKIARDITERKRLVRELEEANRLKDEFLATLSHELRTPLNAIMGYGRMLRSGSLAEELRARALELIDRNAHSLARLVSDVLDVSRIVSGKMRLSLKPCDVTSVVAAAIEVVRPTLDVKRIELDFATEPGPTSILGDPDRLQQVFWNLLTNAAKFTPDGGRISVRVSRTSRHARIRITDTGTGIDAALLPHVFERFRQGDTGANREMSGLGLGLSLVRHLVELHTGRVVAASPGPGLGSTFEVTLPLQLNDVGGGLP
jgi:PAS domain S-box-containing protein